MGTFSQGHVLQSSGLLPPAAGRSSHRSSLKAPASASSSSRSNGGGQGQVRWPMNLDQLAAISLDDDSDLDHSFNEGSTNDMRPINLLRMLKDSDDESSHNALPASPARRTLHTRPKSMHALTVSSTANLHGPSGGGGAGPGPSQSGIPMPSSVRSRARSQSTSEQPSLRQRQSDGALSSSRLQQQQQQQRMATGIQKPGSTIGGSGASRAGVSLLAQPASKGGSNIGRPNTTAANATKRGTTANSATTASTTTAVRAAPTLAKPRVVAARHTSVKLVQGPSATAAAAAGQGAGIGAKGKPSLLPGSNSSSSTNLSRSSSASSKVPGSSKVGSASSSPSSSLSQPLQLLQQQQQQQRSSPGKTASPKDPLRKSAMPTPVSRSRQASSTSVTVSPMTKTGTLNKQQQQLQQQQQQQQSSPAMSVQQPTSAIYSRSIKQQTVAVSQAVFEEPTMQEMDLGINGHGGGGQFPNKNQWSTHELIQELEQWKAEAQAFKAERAAAESWQQQYLILQRDLDAALDSLQAAEERAHRAESNTRALEEELHAAVAAKDDHAMMLEELTVARESREQELEAAQDDHRQLIEEQAAKIAQLEVENEDFQQKLDQAQIEMDQLVEAQSAPPDVQEVQHQLAETAHELARIKAEHSKVVQALEAEKEKVTMEQADAGHLLSKLSRLQDINANLVRDNNALKERMLEHEGCLEREQTTAAKHLKQAESFQAEIRSLQHALDQALDQTQAMERQCKDQERTFKDQERQCLQLQQQVQIQQTQIQQQQSEIVTLRATVEVERQQNQLWLQHQQQQLQMARAQQVAATSAGGGGDLSFNNGHSSFVGRRPSMDGDLGGSVAHFADTSAMNSMGMGFDGLPPMPINTAKAANMMNRSMDGSFTPLPSSNADMSVGSITGPGNSQSDAKPRTIQRSSSGSMNSVLASSTGSNRHSMHGDSMATQSIEELTAQLESLMKEKERLQAELSKIPLSGGGPMTRRKVEMLEEQMDETDRAMSKIRYSIRMRS